MFVLLTSFVYVSRVLGGMSALLLRRRQLWRISLSQRRRQRRLLLGGCGVVGGGSVSGGGVGVGGGGKGLFRCNYD